VWRASLDTDSRLVARFADTLAPDEAARADRLATPTLRDRFVVGRGLQRDILGRYLRVAPGAIRLGTGPQGKPGIENGEAAGLRFNASNAAGLAVIVVAWGRDVGVDVEELRPVPDADALVERFFALGERLAFQALPAGERSAAFLRCWTRKEAYVKAIGAGLSMPLRRFEVTVGPAGPPRILHADDDPDAPTRWSLCDLEPAPGYVGTVAVEGGAFRLRLFPWEPRAGS
jgi:4'-phosphopantetheinyl transferase